MVYRYFDLYSELFPVQFGQQVNQVQMISHVHRNYRHSYLAQIPIYWGLQFV